MLGEETLVRAGIGYGRRAMWGNTRVGQVGMLDAGLLDSVTRVTVDTSSVSVPVAAAAVVVDGCHCHDR
jgi:hypothetical protein